MLILFFKVFVERCFLRHMNKHKKIVNSNPSLSLSIGVTRSTIRPIPKPIVMKRLLTFEQIINKNEVLATVNDKFKTKSSSIANHIQAAVYVNNKEEKVNFNKFYENANKNLKDYLKQRLRKHGLYIFNLELFAEYMKFTENADKDTNIDVESF